VIAFLVFHCMQELIISTKYLDLICLLSYPTLEKLTLSLGVFLDKVLEFININPKESGGRMACLIDPNGTSNTLKEPTRGAEFACNSVVQPHQSWC
jgi:hypothetical protein